ncbi:MAG: phytanoyl-CoA dioxygenase family protein [Chthoniobacterales bacterium]
MQLTAQQINFFETFGYLKLPQAFKNDLAWIDREFEQVFVDRGIVHDGTKRSVIVPFVDQREKLCGLLDHPVVLNAAKSLLDPDFNYVGSDGNYYSGDTVWHRDSSQAHLHGKYLKMAFYLDPVGKENGALRVIPGSHRVDIPYWNEVKPEKSQELWGIKPCEVPVQILNSEPGDLLIFNHSILHASFGGSKSRRMFTLNLCRHASTEEEMNELEHYVRGHNCCLHSELMRNTANTERMKHLQQVIEVETLQPA